MTTFKHMTSKLPILLLPGCCALAMAQPPAPPDQLYAQRCGVCHGDRATGSDRGPSLARSRRLRGRSATEIRDIIRNGTPGGMPPFALPEKDLQALAPFVQSMNATAFDAQPAGC